MATEENIRKNTGDNSSEQTQEDIAKFNKKLEELFSLLKIKRM